MFKCLFRDRSSNIQRRSSQQLWASVCCGFHHNRLGGKLASTSVVASMSRVRVERSTHENDQGRH